MSCGGCTSVTGLELNLYSAALANPNVPITALSAVLQKRVLEHRALMVLEAGRVEGLRSGASNDHPD